MEGEPQLPGKSLMSHICMSLGAGDKKRKALFLSAFTVASKMLG